MAERLVVVGGDAAGMAAASQARRRRPADDLEIVALERGRHVSYSACGIPYWIGGAVSTVDDLVARTPAMFQSNQDIEVRLRHEAVGLDLDRREVLVRDRDGGGERRLGFDQLVLGTGAVPVRPPLPGIDAPGVYGVQTLDDGEAVRAAVDAGARRAVVVGGGYIGLEMAEAFVQRGLTVTVVEAAHAPMASLDPDMGRLVAGAMEGMGITLLCNEPVQAVDTEPGDGRVRAVVTAEREIPADLVVLGLGVRPNTALAAGAGIRIGVTGGIVTDVQMRTASDQAVWAVGDCVETINRVSLAPTAVALGTHANK
ncbi:MAG TPA: FAD-dependent oxidoreductase, partial [Pseudonocardiaceae bacterium]